MWTLHGVLRLVTLRTGIDCSRPQSNDAYIAVFSVQCGRNIAGIAAVRRLIVAGGRPHEYSDLPENNFIFIILLAWSYVEYRQ